MSSAGRRDWPRRGTAIAAAQPAFVAHSADGLELVAIDVQEPAQIMADYMGHPD